MTLETFLSYLSGLHWAAPQVVDLATLFGTTVVLHVCDGIMCRLFAINNGYPPRLWLFLGFAFGVWAMTVLILVPRRTAASPPHRGPT